MSTNPTSTPATIPRGVSDLFGGAAVAKRQAEARLRGLAHAWAYVEVIPPTFEYAETLAGEAGEEIAEELYRFLDRDGRALALRPDLTIPVARLVGTRLFDQPLPHRLFYAGPAFRYEAPRAGRQREFWQAGIELIGAGSVEADAEVLAFAVQALQALGLDEITFTLGHLGFFHGLIEHLRLEPFAIATLQRLLDRKSLDGLAGLAETVTGDAGDRTAVKGLLSLSGALGAGVLDQAEGLVRNRRMAEAITRLRQVATRLEHFGVRSYFAIDLADVRGMDYYTGVTFKAYTPQMGFSIVNGGRYDNLVGHFGPNLPAVGCAFYLDRILLARQRQGAPPDSPEPDLLIQPCPCGGYVRLAAEARSAGKIVAFALGPETHTPSIPVLRCACESDDQQ